MNRKEFILSVLSLAFISLPLKAIGSSSLLELGVIKYKGSYNLRNTGLKKLLWEISKRTSIELSFKIAEINLKNKKELFKHPLLYLTGDKKFSFSKKEIQNLKIFLSFGGLLFIDSASSTIGEFDNSVNKLIEKLYSKKKLVIASKEHVIYRTFNLLEKPYGRVSLSSNFYIIEEDDRVEVLYSKNDIIGALSVDDFGAWKYATTERNREMAYRTGVNIIMYATCLDYKADQVHVDYLLKNRK